MEEKDLDDVEAFLSQALKSLPEAELRSIQLARCKVAIRRMDYALALEILDSLATNDESSSERRWRLELRVEILQGLGEHDEANRLLRSLRIDDLLRSDVPSLDLRAQALALFKKKYCAEAERIYLQLVKNRFELGSTHCHLSRIYLMLDRFDHAFQHIKLAEQHCRDLSYIRARTIFLRILQCYINQRSTGNLLAQLRQTLSEPGAFEHWTMEPVVDHLKAKERLSVTQIEILMILVKVLSSVTNLPHLDTITSLDVQL